MLPAMARAALSSGRERAELTALLRTPLFVPANVAAFKALDQFKRAATRMALAIGEHGGVQDLLTATGGLAHRSTYGSNRLRSWYA
jgi:CBS domain containing-hemolysin-like protein